MGWTLPIPANATYIASVHWAGPLRLRLEEIAADERSAGASADSLNGMLNLFRAAGGADSPGDEDVKALVDSIAIQHRKDRVVLTATIPSALLKKVTESAKLDTHHAAP